METNIENKWIFSILIEKKINKKRFLMSRTINPKGDIELRPLSEEELAEINNILRNIELSLEHIQDFEDYKLTRYIPVEEKKIRTLNWGKETLCEN